MKKSRVLTAYILTMALILSMFMPVNTSVPAQAAAKLKLNKTKVSLYEGKRTKLTVKNAGKKKVVWSTSNKNIVRVSQKGSVLAVKAGTAIVKATVKGTKKSAGCKVVVGKYATELKINSAENVILKEGETTDIKVSVSPSKVLSKAVTYKSANPEIAAVSASGEITAVKQGLTEITIKTKAKNKKEKKLTKKISVYVEPVFEEETEDSNKETENETTNGSTEENTESNNGSSTGGNSNSNSDSAAKPIVDKVTEGNTQIYILDKNYEDQVTVSLTVNDKTWNKPTTVTEVLTGLANSYTTEENAAKTIRVSREAGEEWWTATDLTTGNILFRVKAETSYEGSRDYGQIIVEQVSENISIKVR